KYANLARARACARASRRCMAREVTRGGRGFAPRATPAGGAGLRTTRHATGCEPEAVGIDLEPHRTWPESGPTINPDSSTASKSAPMICPSRCRSSSSQRGSRSEEHTSELQSRFDLVCRLLLEKKK